LSAISRFFKYSRMGNLNFFKYSRRVNADLGIFWYKHIRLIFSDPLFCKLVDLLRLLFSFNRSFVFKSNIKLLSIKLTPNYCLPLSKKDELIETEKGSQMNDAENNSYWPENFSLEVVLKKHVFILFKQFNKKSRPPFVS
jgi:hypothetical protein